MLRWAQVLIGTGIGKVCDFTLCRHTLVQHAEEASLSWGSLALAGGSHALRHGFHSDQFCQVLSGSVLFWTTRIVRMSLPRHLASWLVVLPCFVP